MSNYAELMARLRETNQNFRKEWRRWKEGKLNHKQKLKLRRLKLRDVEPETVTLARRDFIKSFDELYDTKLGPLEVKFQINPQLATDEILEFLSVDILAHRCGYLKEHFLKEIKRIELTSEQQQELRQISLTLCETYNFHREFRRWCRLAIIIADEDFIRELKKLSTSLNRYAQIKSKWVLDMIARHRKDLAKAFISSPE